MKIDAKLTIYEDNGDFSEDTVTVDVSYVGDEEEMISWVEEEVYRKYGKSLFYGRDFSISNFDEILEEMEQAA
jgi:hypothetical protein